MRVRVEVCVTSGDEALAAEKAGADAVELCTWLACGGLTPSYGFVNTLNQRLRITRRVLVRPSPGGFLYSADERQMILRDAMLMGLNGGDIVTGALTPEDDLDGPFMHAIRLAAPDSGITLHRAIDHARDPEGAVDTCVQLGIHRMLTSGGHTHALDGAVMLRKLVERAKGRLLIAAAGGINPANVVEVVQRTGVEEVHFSAQLRVMHTTPKAAMSSDSGASHFAIQPDEAKIHGVLNALVKAGLR
jgi:copper homeostasis protein